MFQLFYYHLGEKHFDKVVSTDDPSQIERSTATLIALCCPDKTEREKLWKRYLAIIDGKDPDVQIVGGSNSVTASVVTIGDLTSYLNDVLELTEKSTAAFL